MFEYQNETKCIEKNCSVYTCAKIQVDILENEGVWHFEGRKRPFFMLFPGIYFPEFSNFVLFVAFKKCSMVIVCAFWTKN